MPPKSGKESQIQNKRVENFLSHQDDMVLSRGQAPLASVECRLPALPEDTRGKGRGVPRVRGLRFAGRLRQVPFGLFRFGAVCTCKAFPFHSMPSQAEPGSCLFFPQHLHYCVASWQRPFPNGWFASPSPRPSTHLLFLSTQNVSSPMRDRMDKV